MRRKMMLIYGALMLLIVVFSTLLISREVVNIYIENERQKLDEIAVLFASQNDSKSLGEVGDAGHDFANAMDTRITLIAVQEAEKGEVLLDTRAAPGDMENHRGRVEYQEALQGMVGEAIRESDTTGETYLYRAFPNFTVDEEAVVLRLAKPLHSLHLFTRQIVVINLLVLGGLIIIGMLVFNFLSSTVLKPLNDLSNRINQMENKNSVAFLPKYREGQVDQLAVSFNKLLALLNENVDKVQRNNRELAAVFENVNSGLIVMDRQAKVLVCNQLALDLFETSSDKFLMRRFFENVRHPDLIQEVRAAASTLEKRSFEISWMNENIYNIQISPLHKEERDMIIGILMVVENVTDLRSMEKMRKEFVANVSHELKTPLTTIRGFVETLLNDDLDNPEIIRKFLHIIDSEADRLQLMIFQLLFLSKLDSKGSHEEKGAIRLVDFVERLQYTFKEKAAEKDISLQFDISPPDLEVYSSENLLMQVVSNLIGNALKYSQGSYVAVQFSVKNEALHLEVADDGIGIAEKDQDRIFERFYRVEKSRAQTKGGTGLGLAIVKHLVANAGGSIELISDTNQGSRFIVILPVLSDEGL